MKHRSVLVGLCLAAGCTYNTYKTSSDAPIGVGDDDAGARESLGTGGTAGAAGSTATAGTGGDAGSALVSNAGSSALPAGPACTGCVQLAVVTGRVAEYQLEFDARRNLSNSLVLWRVRVRDYVGDVQLAAYAESGDHSDPSRGFSPESAASFVTLNAAAGWQDVGIDLQPVEPFSPPILLDAGGAAGGSFNPGTPFDKSRVERIGLQVHPFGQSGVFTPATVELDAVTFSPQQNLRLEFSADQGGFELVDPESGSVTFVPD